MFASLAVADKKHIAGDVHRLRLLGQAFPRARPKDRMPDNPPHPWKMVPCSWQWELVNLRPESSSTTAWHHWVTERRAGEAWGGRLVVGAV